MAQTYIFVIEITVGHDFIQTAFLNQAQQYKTLKAAKFGTYSKKYALHFKGLRIIVNLFIKLIITDLVILKINKKVWKNIQLAIPSASQFKITHFYRGCPLIHSLKILQPVLSIMLYIKKRRHFRLYRNSPFACNFKRNTYMLLHSWIYRQNLLYDG